MTQQLFQSTRTQETLTNRVTELQNKLDLSSVSEQGLRLQLERTQEELAQLASSTGNSERIAALEELIKLIHGKMGVGPYGRGNIGMNQAWWDENILTAMDNLNLLAGY